MVRLLLILIVFTFLSLGFTHTEDEKELEELSLEYIKMGLAIRNCYPDISFYYRGGPNLTSFTSGPGITFKPKFPIIPKDSLIIAIESFNKKLDKYISSTQSSDTANMRAKWIKDQLSAFKTQIRIKQGEKLSFDEESFLLYGFKAPAYDEQFYRSIVAELDKILPGEGSVRERYINLSQKFVIPKEKVDIVIKAILAESRRRTLEKIKLPEGESVKLEYVKGELWEGASTYQGNNSSNIQINLDLPINIYRAVDLVCHEGYPGHHLYSVMMDNNVQTRGWVELAMRLKDSPQSFISEGIANYGIGMVFPINDFNKFIKEVLIPLANLDTADAGIFFKARSIKNQMKYLRNDIARGYINGTMSEADVLKWQYDFGLLTVEEAAKGLKRIKEYRSFEISYNYGEDLVRNYVETKTGQSGSGTTKWEVFEMLIRNSNLIIASGLKN